MDIGTWVRVKDFVGLVLGTHGDGTLKVFNPGDRQLLNVTPDAVSELPVGTIDVTMTWRVDVPHGLAEDALIRWAASAMDPVLRQRGIESLQDAGLSALPFDVVPDVEVREVRQPSGDAGPPTADAGSAGPTDVLGALGRRTPDEDGPVVQDEITDQEEATGADEATDQDGATDADA